MKRYGSGVLAAALATFMLCPVPDMVTQFVYSMTAVVVYISIVGLFRKGWPLVYRQPHSIWIEAGICCISIAVTIGGFAILYACMPS